MRALGYTEWPGFNFVDIPKTALNRSFNVQVGDARSSDTHDQQSQDAEMDFVVRIFRAPDGKPGEVIDETIALSDTVISAFLKAANRTTQTEIKNVFFDSLTVKPLNDENDNGVVAEIAFRALVIISTL
jgi:hypothetical protein